MKPAGAECYGEKIPNVVDNGHYVYGSMRQDWDDTGRASTWGYCEDCGNIVVFIEYTISHGVTSYAWVDYHYPVKEWPLPVPINGKVSAS